LVDHKNAGLWLPTGGHVEPGEHPRATVLREAQEELGIEAVFRHASPLMLSVAQTRGSDSHTDVSLWYVLQLARSTALTPDLGEFHAVRWFGPNELPYERSDPHMRRFVAKLRAAQR
ncbi:MAG: NUDIX domain-containing protein, partial [Polyangiales bacterium]